MLRFERFSGTSGDLSFWVKLADLKKNEWKLSDSPRCVYGRIEPHNNSLIFCAIDPTGDDDWDYRGTIINVNSMSEFKALDKSLIMKEFCKKMSDEIAEHALDDGEKKQMPSRDLLNRFLVISFANLKTFKFYYLAAVPVLAPKQPFVLTAMDLIPSHQHDSLVSQLSSSSSRSIVSFFTVSADLNLISPHPSSPFYYGFNNNNNAVTTDPQVSVSWCLRNFLLWVVLRIGSTRNVKIVYVMKHASYILSVTTDADEASLFNNHDLDIRVFQAWERNEQDKIVPKLIDLSHNLDPALLMESAVDLNLKLMKWRIATDLDLDSVRRQKCLLLGSGTLGCNVARNLLSWGVTDITFVDNGTVSFSNPVRQSLYTFEDCLEGGREKALAAAERICQIYPKVRSRGVSLSIPMPGHVGASDEDLTALEALIQSHDVIFVLTDSRESRWLPTFLARAHGKRVLNVALGFDSFVITISGDRDDLDASGKRQAAGCYFCSDIVAPINSRNDQRTLDQQCTVTRPGVSHIAASLAVELMASFLQPAHSSVLGQKKPHQIRGFLSNLEFLALETPAFERCICCSPLLQDRFRREGHTFLKQVIKDPLVLELETGLDVMKAELDDLLSTNLVISDIDEFEIED